ncbi:MULTISPECIES: ABC transporter permease [unclassified Pseudoalteromonas]|uniref:ABC transporter permease n=1 Tax=unclassified Pseudoalteromonas TaxID=194690 RepID=UPI00386AE671
MSINNFSKVVIVAKDEWRYWLRSKLAMTVLAIGLVLTLASVIVTAITMMELSHTRHELQTSAEQSFVDQPDRHPHRMVHYGHYAFRAPSPLSTLDPGIDAYTGNSIFLEGHRQNSAMFADSRQGTALTKLGSLTPAFIVQTLAPLLLILIGYSAISRERESQTLSYSLSQGTSGATLIAGKGLALISVVGLILIPLTVSALFTLDSGEGLLAVASFVFGYALYLTVWVLLILLASSLFSKNSSSFTALAFVWILLCIVMPRVASTTASTAIPSTGKIETDFAVKAELRKLGDGHNINDPAFKQFKQSLLNKYNVSSIDELPVNFRGLVASESEAKLTSVLNKFAEQRMQAELKQTKVSRYFGWVSPMVAIRSLSMIVVGTSIETHHRFLRETEQLRFDFVQGLNKVHVEKLSYQDDMNRNANTAATQKARVSAQNWQVLQDFIFNVDTSEVRTQRSIPAFLQLLLWIAVLLGSIKFVGRRLL